MIFKQRAEGSEGGGPCREGELQTKTTVSTKALGRVLGRAGSQWSMVREKVVGDEDRMLMVHNETTCEQALGRSSSS